jgi:uncharacterized membrane protein YbhN (UPF0104 family)
LLAVRRPEIDREKLRRRLILAQLVAAPIGLVVLGVLLVWELPLARIHEAAGGVAAGVLVGLAGLEAFGARLWLLDRMFDLRVPVRAVWRIHVVTMFYYFFLPAGFGYDLVRAAKLGNASPGTGTWKLAGVASVERIAGGIGLIALMLVALPFTKVAEETRLTWLDPPLDVWLALVAGAVILAAGFYLAVGRRHPRVRLIYPAAAASAGAYALLAAGIWIAAESLGIRISSTEILVALAGTLLFQLIPVNLVGVSFGEVAAVAIYAAYGLDRPEAVFLATIAYLQRLAAALVGGGLEAVHSARWLIGRGVLGRM